MDELQKIEAAPLARVDAGSLLQAAVTSGASIETIERMQDLFVKMEDRNAQKALHVALIAFQGDCPTIKKDHKAGASGSGGFGYDYAPLPTIMKAIQPLLARHGLAVSYDSEVDGSMVKAICKVSHEDGGTMTGSFVVAIDSGGRMGATQKSGSALSYAKRYALVSTLGLVVFDRDDDGWGGQDDEPVDTVTEDQARDLGDMLIEVEADKPKFLKYFRVESLALLPAKDYNRAWAALEGKRKKAVDG